MRYGALGRCRSQSTSWCEAGPPRRIPAVRPLSATPVLYLRGRRGTGLLVSGAPVAGRDGPARWRSASNDWSEVHFLPLRPRRLLAHLAGFVGVVVSLV